MPRLARTRPVSLVQVRAFAGKAQEYADAAESEVEQRALRRSHEPRDPRCDQRRRRRVWRSTRRTGRRRGSRPSARRCCDPQAMTAPRLEGASPRRECPSVVLAALGSRAHGSVAGAAAGDEPLQLRDGEPHAPADVHGRDSSLADQLVDLRPPDPEQPRRLPGIDQQWSHRYVPCGGSAAGASVPNRDPVSSSTYRASACRCASRTPVATSPG